MIIIVIWRLSCIIKNLNGARPTCDVCKGHTNTYTHTMGSKIEFIHSLLLSSTADIVWWEWNETRSFFRFYAAHGEYVEQVYHWARNTHANRQMFQLYKRKKNSLKWILTRLQQNEWLNNYPLRKEINTDFEFIISQLERSFSHSILFHVESHPMEEYVPIH